MNEGLSSRAALGRAKPMESSLRDPDPSRWRSRLFCLTLFLFVFGAAAGFNFASLLPALMIVAFVVLLAVIGKHHSVVIPSEHDEWFTPSSANRTDALPAPTPPRPFEKRLAQFLHCDLKELDTPRDERRSKMIFWSVVPLGPGRGPKPAWLIRQILQRIHRLVHG